MEGADLVAAGLAAGRRPQVVFVRAEHADALVVRLGLSGGGAAAGPPPAVYPVAEHVAHRIGTLESPADVLAVFDLPVRQPFALPTVATRALVVYADGIGDPGNLGTLLRAAVAFGAAAFVTAPGSADLYGPKTVRAGMGAVFALPLYPDVTLGDLVARLPGAGVYGLAAHGGEPLAGADLRCPAVLVVGAERAGVSAQARPYVTRSLTIPLAPDRPASVESLNAGVAGAIALYEFSRHLGAANDPPLTPAAPQEG